MNNRSDGQENRTSAIDNHELNQQRSTIPWHWSKHPVPRSQISYHFSGRNTWGVATCSWTNCHTHSAASNSMHTGVPSWACWNYTITGWLFGAYTFETRGGPPNLVTERVAHDTVAHIKNLWSLWFNFSPGGYIGLTLLAALPQKLKSILLNTRRQRQLDEAKEDQEVNQAIRPATSFEVDRSGGPFKAMFCISY